MKRKVPEREDGDLVRPSSAIWVRRARNPFRRLTDWNKTSTMAESIRVAGHSARAVGAIRHFRHSRPDGGFATA